MAVKGAETPLSVPPAKKRPLGKTQEKYVRLLLPVVSVLLLIVTAEIIIRFYHFLRWDISMIYGQPTEMGGMSPITIDAGLGWRATENYRFEGKKHSADGREYRAEISQDRNGFRMFGDLTSGKPRVFVIGDSFTHAIEASDDKTYYAILKQSLDVEVFAYGGRGYGSLQEWMILEKYFDLIKPDLILWQFSTNDLIDNSPDLEAASTINNHGSPRPYWVNDQIAYILPKEDTAELRFFALRHCRFCYVVINRLDKLAAVTLKQTVETETSKGKPAHPAFLKSVEATDEIMEMVRKRALSIPIFAFAIGTADPYHGPEYEEALAEICRRRNIILLDQIEKAVLAAKENGAVVLAADQDHWNELGHRIAGEALANSLTRIWFANSPWQPYTAEDSTQWSETRETG
jgi:hypothetical protein